MHRGLPLSRAGQRHPAAVVKRQIDRDVTVLMATVGRLTEQQLQLFFLLQSMVLSYKPEGLARLTDTDVALATGALAGSLETASKGVIFEEATASVVAEGLRRALQAGDRRNHEKRRIPRRARGRDRPARQSSAAPDTRAGTSPTGETSYLELVGRVFQQRPPSARRLRRTGPSKPLIVLP